MVANGIAEAHGRQHPYPGAGVKRQTIRARRADGRDPKPGDRLRCWRSMRRPDREFLGQVRCVEAFDLELRDTIYLRVASGGRLLTTAEAFVIAQRDGFECIRDLVLFFEPRGIPFHGWVIRW
jgi:hypothetical protein